MLVKSTPQLSSREILMEFQIPFSPEKINHILMFFSISGNANSSPLYRRGETEMICKGEYK